MAESSRIIEYTLSARDNASSVFAKAEQSLKRFAENAKRSATIISNVGTSTIDRQQRTAGRSGEEQAIRDAVARKTREIHAVNRATSEAMARERINAKAEERMFGKPISTGIAQAATSVSRDGKILVRSITKTRQEAKSEFDRLKSVFGSRGSLKETFEIFRGGGAIAGLTFAARAIRDTAKAAAELADELRQGNITFGQFVEQGSQQLPILGTIRQAGLSIRELLTGFLNLAPHGKKLAGFFDDGTIALREANKELADMDARLAQIAKRQEGVDSVAGSLADQAFITRMSAHPGGQQRAATEIAFRNEMDRIQKERDAIQAELSKPASGNAIIDQAVSDATNRQLRQLEQAERDANFARSHGLAEARKQAEDASKQREEDLKQSSMRIADIEGDAQRDIAQIRSETRVEQFNQQKREIDAEIEQIRAATQREVEVVADEFAKLMRDPMFRGNEDQIRRFEKLSEEKQAAIRDRGLAKEQTAVGKDTEQKLFKQLDAEGKLNQLRIDRLNDEAKFGSVTASLEAQKLQVAQEYADKRKEILELLKEEALTDQQRLAALSELGTLDQREAAATARLGRKAEPVRQATAATGRFSAQEFLAPQLSQQMRVKELDYLRQGVTQGQDQNRYLAQILDLIRRGNSGGAQQLSF